MECLKFDGTTTYEAIGRNQLETAKVVTVVAEPEIDYVDHRKLLRETGEALALFIWAVITATESTKTLSAIGSGTYGLPK